MNDIANDPTVVKANTPFTAAQVKEDCPQQLLELGREAAAHLHEACAHQQKFDEHLASARQILAQVHDLCDEGGRAAFREIFHEKFCPSLGRSRTYEFLAVVTGKKSIEDLRAGTRKRVARHRAKKAESVTVTDTPPLAPAEKRGSDSPSVKKKTPEFSSLTFADMTLEQRRHEVNGIGSTAWVEAIPPAWLEAVLLTLWQRASPAERTTFRKKCFDQPANVIEIATLAGQCIALLTHPTQHIGEIYKKIARIKRLAGDKAKEPGKPEKSNAQLDLDAFARGMSLPGKSFTTITMAPDGVDENGNPSYVPVGRAGRSRLH